MNYITLLYKWNECKNRNPAQSMTKTQTFSLFFIFYADVMCKRRQFSHCMKYSKGSMIPPYRFLWTLHSIHTFQDVIYSEIDYHYNFWFDWIIIILCLSCVSFWGQFERQTISSQYQTINTKRESTLTDQQSLQHK